LESTRYVVRLAVTPYRTSSRPSTSAFKPWK
jgi:hypothetical protein